MTPDRLTDKKMVIFSHYATTGACEELRDWLRESRIQELVYVAFPFGSNRAGSIRAECYRQGKLVKARRSSFRMQLPEPIAYAKDLLYALFYAIRFARGADVMVAGDNLLAMACVLTRWLTGVGQVVYYMIDYTPTRYANRALNALYYAVDRFAASHADAVWPLTDQIIQGRFHSGRLDERHVRWYTVPFGSHPQTETPVSSYERKRVVYMGDIVRNKGAELFVPLACELKRLIPDFRFTVIGGGKDLPALREEVNKAGMGGYFEFCGFIEDIADVVVRLTGAGVAIAPYYPFDANSFTFYSDPGKVKVYLGCGLPVVLTEVPPIAQEIVSQGAGRIARYEPADFANGIACILEDPNYPRIRENAHRLGGRYAWPTVFAEAFARLDASKGKETRR